MTGIKIKGLNEYRQMFKEVERKAPDRIAKKTNDILEEVKEETKSKTPELTGNLKKGFKVEKAVPFGNMYQGKVYNDAPHSHLVEEGHRIVRPKGNEIGWVDGTFMLRNTAEETDARIESDLEKWIPEVYKELNG